MPTLSADHSAWFRQKIRELSGISLPENKSPMIEQRLRRRITLYELPGINAYLTALIQGELPEDELRHVIDLITTNTTSFFREREHFDFLGKEVIPEAIKNAGTGQARIKIWSAAASEGAEAYSAAMVMQDANRSGKMFDWGILGTDISGRMVEKATRAVYDAEQISTVPVDMAQRYVMTARSPKLQGKVRITPELRERVKFRHMNLMDVTYPVDKDVTLIFLRNVLIYFEPVDKAAVVDRLSRHLKVGGYLVVGHSESMIVRSTQLVQVRPTIFKKVA